MKLSDELKYWGYHADISDEGKAQHLEMATVAEALEAYVVKVRGMLETISEQAAEVADAAQRVTEALLARLEAHVEEAE